MPVRRITCQPKSVCTGPTISPGFIANTASSNGLTMLPRAKVPRSPPCAAEPGSCELAFASSANFAGLAFTCAASSSAFCFAAAFSASLASGFTAIRMCDALPLLGLRVDAGVGVVLGLDLGGVDGGLRHQRVERQVDELDLRLLGRLERAGIGVVERLDRRVVDLDVLGERLGVDAGDRDLALLLDQRQVALAAAAGDDAAQRDRLLQRRQRQLAAHARLEHLRRHVLAGEQLLVLVGREAAVVLEHRQVGDELLQLRVGDAEALLPRPCAAAGAGRPAARAAGSALRDCRRSPDRSCGRAAARSRSCCSRSVSLNSSCVIFSPATVATSEVRVGRAEVGVDAEERERQRDQRQDDLGDAFVLGYEIVHVGVAWPRRAPGRGAGNRSEKRANSRSPLHVGGVDGTRTRDPRRDRPVF